MLFQIICLYKLYALFPWNKNGKFCATLKPLVYGDQRLERSNMDKKYHVLEPFFVYFGFFLYIGVFMCFVLECVMYSEWHEGGKLT